MALTLQWARRPTSASQSTKVQERRCCQKSVARLAFYITILNIVAFPTVKWRFLYCAKEEAIDCVMKLASAFVSIDSDSQLDFSENAIKTLLKNAFAMLKTP